MGISDLLIFWRRRLLKGSFLISFLGLLGVFFYTSLFRVPDGRLHVRFLDVGQGDAVWVTTARGQRILIDGGPDGRAENMISRLLPANDKTIDLVILTHPHADHVGGLLPILSSFRVKNLVFERSDYPTATFARFLSLVEEEKRLGAKVFQPQGGEILSLGEVKIKIFWPEAWERVSHLANENDHSIVSLLSYGDFDVFLPGDQERDEAEKMLASTEIPEVEVLKAAHHGSRNGLSEILLELLRPDLVVISAGKNNSYGHPHPETLDLLSRFGTKLLRTDLNGTIDVVSDGQSWGVQ